MEQLKQELPHVFQPAPEKAEKAATAQQPDHYEALEQMLNNKPRAAQPASKAPAAPLSLIHICLQCRCKRKRRRHCRTQRSWQRIRRWN